MRLESIIAEVRPRNAWEAADLGWLLARSQYGRLVAAWAWMVWPVWAIILVLCRDHVFWGLAWIWWWKPQAEKVPLWLLSRELFGERVGWKELASQWPRVWFGDLGWQLFAGRLSPSRSLHMAMRQLEGKGGRDGVKRASRMASRWGGAAWWSLVFHVGLAHCVAISMLLLALAMVPERYLPAPELWFEMLFGGDDFPRWLVWTWVGVHLTAVTLVAPLSVAAAFGLYVNARSRQEGWDVELVFRRLASRLGTGAGKVAVWGAAAVLFGFGIQRTDAADAESLEAPGTARAEMEAILKTPEFRVFTRTERLPPEVADRPGWITLPAWPVEEISRVVMWALLGLAAAVVAVWLVKWILGLDWKRRRERRPEVSRVTTVLGMNVQQDSLPKDVVRTARELLARGEYEQAVALLYRAALSWLIHRASLPIRESDTEGDCLDRVRESGESSRSYFEVLTRARVASAYGARRLPEEEIEALLVSWPYGAGRREGA
jgi:hypothetical protein